MIRNTLSQAQTTLIHNSILEIFHKILSKGHDNIGKMKILKVAQ